MPSRVVLVSSAPSKTEAHLFSLPRSQHAKQTKQRRNLRKYDGKLRCQLILHRRSRLILVARVVKTQKIESVTQENSLHPRSPLPLSSPPHLRINSLPPYPPALSSFLSSLSSLTSTPDPSPPIDVYHVTTKYHCCISLCLPISLQNNSPRTTNYSFIYILYI